MVQPAFSQVLLSQAFLDYGLVKRSDGMPEPDDDTLIPWLPIAAFSREPSDLEPSLGLRFQATVDDLDELDLVVIDLASGRRIGLFRHRHSPEGGMQLYILPQQYTVSQAIHDVMYAAGIVADAVLLETLDALRIPFGRVTWRYPRLIRAGTADSPGWPKISTLQADVDPLTPTYTAQDARDYLATNPAIPSLRTSTRPVVESVEFLSSKGINEPIGRDVVGWSRVPRCLVTLVGDFRDDPSPCLGPAGSYARVYLSFDGTNGALEWLETDLSGAGLLDGS